MPSDNEQRDRILTALYRALDETNLTLQADKRLAKDLATKLAGPPAALESLGLVNLIVAAEQQIEDEFGVTVNLADQQAATAALNPLETVDTLAAYIGDRLRDQPGA